MVVFDGELNLICCQSPHQVSLSLDSASQTQILVVCVEIRGGDLKMIVIIEASQNMAIE